MSMAITLRSSNASIRNKILFNSNDGLKRNTIERSVTYGKKKKEKKNNRELKTLIE